MRAHCLVRRLGVLCIRLLVAWKMGLLAAASTPTIPISLAPFGAEAADDPPTSSTNMTSTSGTSALQAMW